MPFGRTPAWRGFARRGSPMPHATVDLSLGTDHATCDALFEIRSSQRGNDHKEEPPMAVRNDAPSSD